MPSISEKTRERISEQIIHYLFQVSPSAKFTVEISKEIARDEEFTKKLLTSLREKGIVIEIKKNKDGLTYLKRQRWRLSSKVYDIYQQRQGKSMVYNNNIYNNAEF